MSEDFVLHAVLTWCISLVSIAKISQLVTSVINVTKFLTGGHILMIMKYVNMKLLWVVKIYMPDVMSDLMSEVTSEQSFLTRWNGWLLPSNQGLERVVTYNEKVKTHAIIFVF